MLKIILVFLLAAAALAQPSKDPKRATSLTGCVDQRDADYVLTGDKELEVLAKLHGDGFDDENFARHMGHRVRVEGTMTTENGAPVMRVRKITHIADTCHPPE